MVDEMALPKVNVTQNAVCNNEPYYQIPESSYTLTESKYAPMAEEMQKIQLVPYADVLKLEADYNDAFVNFKY